MPKEIVRALIGCAVTYAMLQLAACSPVTLSTATEREICIAWRDSLFRPSRQDTAGTQAGLTSAYWVQGAACPAEAAE